MATEAVGFRGYLSEKHRLLTFLFILSEATFFAFLIIAYVFFQTFPAQGPQAKDVLDPGLTLFFSLFLFASSGTIWLGERALKHGNPAHFGPWLAVTIVLGLIFLGGQVHEWNGLIHEGVTISRNLFGTTFYTLTGLHGLHVIIGLIGLLALMVLERMGDFRTGITAAVDCVSMYWHFVDVVWVLLYGIIYVGAVLK